MNTAAKAQFDVRAILPIIHLLLCIVTAAASQSTPGGTWYRLVALDPFCSIFLWSTESNMAILAVFASLGTAGYWVISQAGSESRRGRMNRLMSALASVLCAFFGFVASFTFAVVQADLRTGVLSPIALIQYTLIFVLWAGAWYWAWTCAVAAFKPRRAINPAS